MIVESALYFVNDPLLFGRVVEAFPEVPRLVGGSGCPRVGIGHYEDHHCLRAEVRSPEVERVAQTLGRLRTRVAMASCYDRTQGGIESLPVRYRDWMCAMGGFAGIQVPEGEADLAIPTYIRRNMLGSSVGETLFHLFLAFLHSRGLMGRQAGPAGAWLDALRAAVSQHGTVDEARERGGVSLMISDGRTVLGAALGRPMYYRRKLGSVEGEATGNGLESEDPAPHGGSGSLASTGHLKSVVLLDTQALPPPEWTTIPPNSVFEISAAFDVRIYAE
jgi:hypothetical protein